eukprot:10313800-Lingulodinium_polyedra.AAC.1
MASKVARAVNARVNAGRARGGDGQAAVVAGDAVGARQNVSKGEDNALRWNAAVARRAELMAA